MSGYVNLIMETKTLNATRIPSGYDGEVRFIPLPRKVRGRKRNTLSPAQIRHILEILRTGLDSNVKFSFDAIEMAHQAVDKAQRALRLAIEILEGTNNSKGRNHAPQDAGARKTTH